MGALIFQKNVIISKTQRNWSFSTICHWCLCMIWLYWLLDFIIFVHAITLFNYICYFPIQHIHVVNLIYTSQSRNGIITISVEGRRTAARTAEGNLTPFVVVCTGRSALDPAWVWQKALDMVGRTMYGIGLLTLKNSKKNTGFYHKVRFIKTRYKLNSKCSYGTDVCLP